MDSIQQHAHKMGELTLHVSRVIPIWMPIGDHKWINKQQKSIVKNKTVYSDEIIFNKVLYNAEFFSTFIFIQLSNESSCSVNMIR